MQEPGGLLLTQVRPNNRIAQLPLVTVSYIAYRLLKLIIVKRVILIVTQTSSRNELK